MDAATAVEAPQYPDTPQERPRRRAPISHAYSTLDMAEALWDPPAPRPDPEYFAGYAQALRDLARTEGCKATAKDFELLATFADAAATAYTPTH